MSNQSWLRLMGILAAAAVFLALPLSGFRPELCSLLYPGGLDRRAHDPGLAQRDFGPHHSPTLGSVGMIFLVHRRSNQFKRSDNAAEPGQDW